MDKGTKATMEETKQFLWMITGRDSELPEPICFNIWSKNPSEKGPRSFFYFKSEIDKAVEVAETLNRRSHIYVTPGFRGRKLAGPSRGKLEDVVGIAGLWVEADFIRGETHKEVNLPESEEEAMKLITPIIPSMPPTVIINSGGGLYGFWLFKKPWIFQSEKEKEEAIKLQKSLYQKQREVATEYGWKIDCVANLSQCLRLVGTANIKDPKDIRIAKFVELSNRYYDVDDLKRELVMIPTQKRENKIARLKSPVETEFPPADFEEIKQKCGFISYCVKQSAMLPEPEWYAMLSIVCRCENGEELCHELSEEYPGYSESETQKKILHAIHDTGPFTCEYIEANVNDEFCSLCDFYKKIKSPINLGIASCGYTGSPLIDRLNQEYAVILAGSKFCVMRESVDPIFNRPSIDLMAITDFKYWLCNDTITTINNKQIPVADIWLKSRNRRQYDGIIFSPNEGRERYYNLWRGFNVEAIEGDCSLYLSHIQNVIAGGDKEIYHWILAWMARIIQDPGGKRPGTAIVLKGMQGTGKGIFVKYFGKIFGSHFLHISSSNQLTGHFNNHLKDAILVFCDEATWGGDKIAEGVLKGMITEDTIVITPKGKDSYSIRNNMNLIVASNNEWVVPAAREERRFMVLEVKDEYKGKTKYFKDICDQMDNGGCEALHHFLRNLDISNVNLRCIPRTEALLEQIFRTMTPFQKWWHDSLIYGGFFVMEKDANERPEERFNCWHANHETKSLYDSYVKFCNQIGTRNYDNQAMFGKHLREICPSVQRNRLVNSRSVNSRDFYYAFPHLEKCRKDFEDGLGVPIDWKPDYDEIEEYEKERQLESEKIKSYFDTGLDPESDLPF